MMPTLVTAINSFSLLPYINILKFDGKALEMALQFSFKVEQIRLKKIH